MNTIWNNIKLALHQGKLHCFLIKAKKNDEIWLDYPIFPPLIKTIKLLTNHLEQNKLTTVRDLFYLDVMLFSNQLRCKQALELVTQGLGWNLEEIGIVLSQKGLMYGRGNINLDGAKLSLNYTSEPVLIPLHAICLGADIDVVVILEKDAVFKWFCTYIRRIKLRYNLIVITAKGFPDRLTKRLVQELALSCPVLAFVDADIYGIYICKSFETPSIEYSGMYLLDFIEGTVDIKDRERNIIINLLIKLVDDSSKVAMIYKRELTRGLFFSKKAEMNICGSNEDLKISEYLASKVDTFLLDLKL